MKIAFVIAALILLQGCGTLAFLCIETERTHDFPCDF